MERPAQTNNESQPSDQLIEALIGHLTPPAESDSPDPAPWDQAFPREAWKKLGQAGLLGLSVPRELGGGGLSYPGFCRATTAVAEHGCHLGLAVSWLMQNLVAANYFGRYASPAQAARYLEPLLSGESLIAIATSEPQGGAHPKYLSTKAERQPDGFLIDGQKAFVTHAPQAAAFIVLCVTETLGRRKQFSALVVPSDAPGLVVEPSADFALMRPVGHGGLTLKGCAVPGDALLGPEGQALDMLAKPFRALEEVTLSAFALGQIRTLLRNATHWPSVADTEESAEALGRLRAKLSQLELAVEAAAQRLEGKPTAPVAVELAAAREAATGFIELYRRLATDLGASVDGTTLGTFEMFFLRGARKGFRRLGQKLMSNEVS